MKVKEKPILFSTPMIQAIQDNRKKQTRRITGKYLKHINESPNDWALLSEMSNGKFRFENLLTGEILSFPCPYGDYGDELWVRETFFPTPVGYALYRADAQDGKLCLGTVDSVPVFGDVSSYKWKPSLFMPREFSRIQLLITGKRIERLQDITEDDAIAEGVKYWADDNDVDLLDAVFKNYETGERNLVSAYSSFMSLWDSINGELKKDDNDYSSKANPWVLVVEFEKL